MSSTKKPHSILIVGLGSIGERHLRCFQNTGRFSVAGCELNPEIVGRIAERYSCPVFNGLDEALAAQNFDAAVICTLANSHLPIATQCVKRNLHVLIEKPLALTPEGLAEFLELAQANRRIVRVAYTSRSLPLASEVKRRIEAGAIGKVRHAVSVSGQHFPTYRPAYRTIYYRSHETGGGAIQDALTHQLHTMEWLLGPIERVFATAAHQVLPDVEVEDTVNVSAVMAGGALVGFSFNQFQAPNETFLQLNGTLGSLRWEMSRQRLGVFALGDQDWAWTQAAAEELDGAYLRQANAFADELQGSASPLATFEEGWQTLNVNRAVLESARSHLEVRIS